ncbi:hypothetical protein BDV09DRAFT_180926 [Aspergillus tetrazonus]
MPKVSRGLKSRHGCGQCKQRRVKCDERKPRCYNCIRFNEACSFRLIEPFVTMSAGNLRLLQCGVSAVPHPQLSSTQDQKHDQESQPREVTFTLEDMRLLNHFINHTAETLSDSLTAQRIWRTSVVECAFNHIFLLEGILSLAALHMAMQNSEQAERLSILAATKQNTALQGYRFQLRNITPENCEAVFAFSFLACYYVPASAGTVINPAANFLEDDLLSAMVSWLRLCHGANSIHKYAGEWIRRGPLEGLLRQHPSSGYGRYAEICGLNAPQLQRLRELEDLCNPHGKRENFPYDNLDVKEINLRALTIFKGLLSCLQDKQDVNHWVSGQSSHPLSDAETTFASSSQFGDKLPDDLNAHAPGFNLSLLWLFEIPIEFIELLEKRNPISLIIFAHFSLLLLHGPQFWLNRPIANKIVQSVAASLDHRYFTWIQWPIERVL